MRLLIIRLVILFGLFFPALASADTPISDARVFAYAEANYSSIFAGSPTAGQYQQYDYRYYPASGNYLAVNTGMIYVLGQVTGNVITSVGPVESFRSYITNWETAQAAANVNYSGTWLTNYGGYSITASITQTGSNISVALSSQALSSGQVFAGTLNGNTVNASKSDYAGTATATLTFLNSTTASVVLNSCTSNSGYYCIMPNGTTLTITKQ